MERKAADRQCWGNGMCVLAATARLHRQELGAWGRNKQSVESKHRWLETSAEMWPIVKDLKLTLINALAHKWVTADTWNQQSQTSDKGRKSRLGVGWGMTTSHRKIQHAAKCEVWVTISKFQPQSLDEGKGVWVHARRAYSGVKV